MVNLKIKSHPFLKQKRNIILLVIFFFILLETGILAVGVAHKGKEDDLALQSRLTISDIGSTLETTTSAMRYKFEMALSGKKSVSIYEATKNEKKLRYLIGAFGPKKSMEMLLEETRGGALQDCHQQAHTIGRVSYRIYKERALTEVNYDCHSGYLHGAIEEFLKENGTEDIANKIDKMCNSLQTGFSRFECLHGSGHGILAVDNYELHDAINDCKKMGTSYTQSSCFGGVFMENIIAAQGFGAYGHITKWVNKNPHFPCTEYPEGDDITYQCYLIQTAWMLTLDNYDFKKVSEECMNAPKNMVSVCYKSLGRDIAGYVLRNPKGILEKCGLVNDKQYYRDCIQGAAGVVVEFWGPKLDMQGVEFCREVAEEDARLICFTSVAGQMKMLGMEKPKIERICNQFDDEYQVLCRVN